MEATEVLKVKNEIIVYCVGEDIPSDFSCKRISISGKEFEVIRSGSSRAFCGKMNGLISLSVQDGESVPLGEIKILQ